MDDTRIDVAALFSAIIRRLPRILLITLGLLVAAFVVLMFQPRMYESSSAILVEPRSSPYVRASNEQAPSISGNEVGVVSSQIELLKSRDTLLGVIDELDLRSVPEFNGSASGFSPLAMIMQIAGRRAATPNSIDETVLTALYERLNVAQERDSRIISVTVSTTDPELSARIANAVASAHVARRAQLSISDTADATGWLREEIDRLRVAVQDAESAVANFRVENDLFTGQNNTSLLDQELSNISGQITAAQERKSAAMSRATLIRGLIERGQPIEGVANVQDSVVIQRLSEEKARLQGEQAQRSATLLSNHPSIRALNAQIAELNNQIRIEGGRVAAALEAEAKIEADLEASLQAELARAKSSASLATRETVTLDSLEREAKAQRDLLEAYLLRFNEASSRVDANSALPDVRVVSEAAPSVTAASPKTTLIMIAVGVLSVVVQVGAAAFGELMSGRALAPVTRESLGGDVLEEAPFDVEELEPDQRWEAEGEEEVLASTAGHDLSPLDELAGDLSDMRPSAAVQTKPGAKPTPDADPASDAVRTFIREQMAGISAASRRARDEIAAKSSVVPEVMSSTDQDSATAKPARVLRYTDLISDLALGRTHLLLLADHQGGQSSRVLAEDLIGDAISKGLSVALIDAGTGRQTHEPGVTDLSQGSASFGNVVQKSADNGFAEVTWGKGIEIDRQSSRPATLVEALGDIYEVVIVLTGQVAGTSSLDLFVELGGRVVLVADDETKLDRAELARQRLENAGLARVEITALAEPVAA
ncbi:GumC family protein [Devosia sp. XK-2]|uniref:GumC family protein n=1 Tax=Devosia sp. XK-2 TaxID=3126689 RepID=UPI0030CF3638